jgi:hypothetical protein
MLPRTALIQLGKLVAKDLAVDGPVSGGLAEVGNALAAHPQAIIELLDLVAKESRKRKPNDVLVEAFAFMIGQALDTLRFAVERNYVEAIEAVAATRARVLALARDGKLKPDTLLLMLRQFVVAKLDLGEELQAVMANPTEHRSVAASPGKGDVDRFLADLAEEHDGDPFGFQARLAEDASAFPESRRAGIAAAVLAAPDPTLREAAVGWLLDAGATTRRDVATLLQQAAAAGLLSGTMLRRMITLRNWVPDRDRPALDAAIRACRQKGVECAASRAAEVKDVVASSVDGSGAQSVFILIKEGRKHAVASLLVKQGIGVRDAWVRSALTKSEADMFLSRVKSELDVYDSDLDFARLALGHFLAVNRTSGATPPFGLVDFVERTGLAAVNPDAVSVEALVARLADDIPARRMTAAAVAKSIKRSVGWDADFTFLDTWFEDDGALDTLLDGKRLSAKRRAALVLEEYLPTRRARWAEILAWTALTLRHDEAMEDRWIDVALVARELLSDRPLADIPLMTFIATMTVEVWNARQF